MSEQNATNATTQEDDTMPMIYKKMARVMAALAKKGIGKDEQNQQQRFKYRSIDSVYNVAAPILAQEGVILMPRITEKKMTRFEVQKNSQGGGYVQINNQCSLTADVYFYAEDGSSTHCTVVAGSIDQGDKAELQAQSQIVKYAIIHAFQIPVVGQDIGDADGRTVDLQAAPAGGGQKEVVAQQNEVQNTNQAQQGSTMIEDFDTAKDQLDTCRTMKQLAESWSMIAPGAKAQLNGYKEHLKQQIAPQKQASLNDQFNGKH